MLSQKWKAYFSNWTEGESYPSALGQAFLSQEVIILLADLRGFIAIAAGHPS